MRPLLLSGLMCVPALIMLAFGGLHDAGTHPEMVTVAPAQVAALARPPLITISLPRAPLQAEPRSTDLSKELLGNGSLTAALAPPEPAPSRPRPPRTLHAVRHSASSVVVAQTVEQRPDTLWARVGQWMAQHEPAKAWPSGGGQG
jgi:hypothetical protein